MLLFDPLFLLSNIRSRKYTSYIYYVGDFPLLIYVYTCKIKTSRKEKSLINEKKLPYRLIYFEKVCTFALANNKRVDKLN